MEGLKLNNTLTDSSIEVNDLDRRTIIRVMPQINERLNAMTYNEINHDSLEPVLNEILPELKGTIYSSIDGASTQDIGYLRRQSITDAI